MHKITAITLSALLALCIPDSVIASEEQAASDSTGQYDIELHPGQHLIIITGPTRQLIRVDNALHQTVSVEAASSLGVPFVHLKIEKPVIAPPQLLISAL